MMVVGQLKHGIALALGLSSLNSRFMIMILELVGNFRFGRFI